MSYCDFGSAICFTALVRSCFFYRLQHFYLPLRAFRIEFLGDAQRWSPFTHLIFRNIVIPLAATLGLHLIA